MRIGSSQDRRVGAVTWVYSPRLYTPRTVHLTLYAVALWVQTQRVLAAGWTTSGADFQEAQATVRVNNLDLVWGVAGQSHMRHRLSCPRRHWQRTISRGPMVRKKASRLQLEVAFALSWSLYLTTTSHVSRDELVRRRTDAAAWFGSSAALTLVVNQAANLYVAGVQLQQLRRLQHQCVAPVLRYALVS